MRPFLRFCYAKIKRNPSVTIGAAFTVALIVLDAVTGEVAVADAIRAGAPVVASIFIRGRVTPFYKK